MEGLLLAVAEGRMWAGVILDDDGAVVGRISLNNILMSYGHVHIDGRWRDDIIFQKLAPWDDGVRERP